MKLRERKWASCPTCNCRTELLEEELFGCDNCQKQFNEETLRFTVFHKDIEAEDFQFCSWACVLEKLKETKTDSFISLPYLSFDAEKEGQTPQDFFALFK